MIKKKKTELLFAKSGISNITYLFLATSASIWGPQEYPGSPPTALLICPSTPALCLHFASVLPQMTNKGGKIKLTTLKYVNIKNKNRIMIENDQKRKKNPLLNAEVGRTWNQQLIIFLSSSNYSYKNRKEECYSYCMAIMTLIPIT